MYRFMLQHYLLEKAAGTNILMGDNYQPFYLQENFSPCVLRLNLETARNFFYE